jgi:hypothetical protein
MAGMLYHAMLADEIARSYAGQHLFGYTSRHECHG